MLSLRDAGEALFLCGYAALKPAVTQNWRLASAREPLCGFRSTQ